MFTALDLSGNEQAAKYDDGVGTSSFKPLALLGGAFGWGLKRNVISCYKFVSRNYEPKMEELTADALAEKGASELFFFGFSRGAFTVRVITALILDQGVIKGVTDSDLHRLATRAYRTYRADKYKSILRIEVPLRMLRDGVIAMIDRIRGVKPYDKAKNLTVESIAFVGVWDTVAAYGLPIDELTRGISDWIWPLSLPDRVLNPRVRKARHAVALDDERTTFHPVLWTEEGEEEKRGTDDKLWVRDQRIAQVWFAGMHANVGGGYPDDSLAYVPVEWMFDEARECGLEFKTRREATPDTARLFKSNRDTDGRLYNSRAGLGAYYRYGPRDIAELIAYKKRGRRGMLVQIERPKIHHSAFKRIDSGRNAYAPIGLPATYDVVNETGEILPVSTFGFETDEQAVKRLTAQNRIWNLVWLRRVTYFLTVAASLYLMIGLVLRDSPAKNEFSSPIRWVSEVLRFLQSFLPGGSSYWINAWARQPELFLITFLLIIGLIWWNLRLGSRIQDVMDVVWRTRGETAIIAPNAFHRAVAALRNNWLYRGSIEFAKRSGVPFLFAVAVVIYGFGILSHIAFNVADAAGAYCKETPAANRKQVNLGIEQPAIATFKTIDLCFATGLTVRAGYKYEITIRDAQGWANGDIPTTPHGYGFKGQPLAQQIFMAVTYPMRRILARSTFNLIARVGSAGNDEYFLDPYPFTKDGQRVPNAYRDKIKAQRDGELFLYVNDAVVALPWWTRWFYASHKGSANITVNVVK